MMAAKSRLKKMRHVLFIRSAVFGMAGLLLCSILAPLFMAVQPASAVVPAPPTDSNGTPEGCPGSILPPPPNANYDCPDDGGSIVNGVYYSPDSGKITGTVSYQYTPTNKPTQKGVCKTSAVTFDRTSGGLPTGDAGATDDKGVYNTDDIQTTPGQVIVKVASCDIGNNVILSGQSAPITVVKNQKLTVDFVAGKVVTNGQTGVCNSNDFSGSDVTSEFGWVACGFINLLSGSIQSMDNLLLSKFLKIDTCKLFDAQSATCPNGGSSDAFYSAWASFRDIALILIVGFGMVSIAMQALDIEQTSGLALRKALPASAAALVAIPFMWTGMGFLSHLGNDLADALMYIIRAPFHGIDVGSQINLASIGIGYVTGAVLSGTAVAAGAAYVALLGLGGIGALMLAGFLGVASALILLEARTIVWDAICITSSLWVALAAFAPTRPAAKIIKDIGLAILLSISGVGAMFALGQCLALIAIVQGDYLAAAIIIITVYAFMLKVWKLIDKFSGQAGEALSSMTGKATKALSAYRGGKIKQRAGFLKEGSLFNDKGIGKTLNNFGKAVGASTASGRFRMSAFTNSATGKNVRALYDEMIQEKNESSPFLKVGQNSDDANAVLAGTAGVNTEEAVQRSARELFTNKETGEYNKERGDAAIAGARAMGINRANSITALRTSMKNKARGYQNGDVRTVDAQVRRLARNEVEYQRLANDTAFWARSSGRADLGGTEWIDSKQDGKVWQEAHSMAQKALQVKIASEAAAGRAMSTDQQRDFYQAAAWNVVADKNMLNGIERVGVQAILTGHDNGAKQAVESLVRIIKSAPEGSDTRLQAAVELKALQGNLSMASGGIAKIINSTLYDQKPGSLGLDFNGNVAEQLASLVGQAHDDKGNPLWGTDEDGNRVPRMRTSGGGLTTLGRTWAEYDADPRKRGNMTLAA